MYTLQQIKRTLPLIECDNAGDAVDALEQSIGMLYKTLENLESVTVKGRQNVDSLLGCMMALEAIIGKDGEDVNG